MLPNRLRLFFGNGVQFQDDTILAVRPYTIASYFNIYRYVSGIFTPEPLDDEDKINPGRALPPLPMQSRVTWVCAWWPRRAC